MRIFIRLIIILIAVHICNMAAAAPKYYGLSSSEGLSNSSVMCITEDSDGLLWIGTWDGLNVYDSYRFVTWRNDPGDGNTISNNIISSIEEQRKGVMWVATNYGINRIDTENGTIKRFYPGYEHKAPLVEKTFSIGISDRKDVFCAARNWGLAFYDEVSGQMFPFNIPDYPSWNIGSIYGGGKTGSCSCLRTDSCTS